MTVRVQNSNNVATYNITGLAHHAQLPDWLAKKNAKALKKDASWSKRITLVQDFGFPEAALRLRFTPDQNFIVGCGVYKPQMRVFDLKEMSMKFERHTNAEAVDMVFLSDDWQKTVLLGHDRMVEFHGSGGVYYGTRIPRAGRAMCYDTRTCDLLIVGSSPDIFRLNLDRGQFMAPFESNASGLNGIDIAPFSGLYGVAGDGGLIELWDRRDRKRASALQAVNPDSPICDMTSIRFVDAMHLAVGDAAGIVRLFDLRSSRPLHTIDHKYGEPILGIQYHSASDCLLSFDSQALRVTKGPRSECHLLTTIMPSVKINDVCSDGTSGFIAMAVEDSQIHSFLCPALGPAPRWASYLDNVISEFGENSKTQSTFDNYRFVTREQLTDLGLDHLKGTKLLRAYMHGYFVDIRLYEKARAIANPFALEEYRRAEAIKKMEAERASRIRANVDAPASNKKRIDDERFQAMYNDDDFAVDAAGELAVRNSYAHRKDKNKH